MIQNNKAVIFRIKTIRKHSNADRLNCTDIFGYNVIIGPGVKAGDLGIYFPEEVQLSHEFCAANNLLRTKDADGKPSGGMFEENRRVKTIKLRGERSEGFWIPIAALSSFGDVSTLKELDCFDVFGGKEICRKYRSKATLDRLNTKKKTSRPESQMMKRHCDTDQFHPNIDSIKIGDLLTFTEKLEGTSFRVSKVLQERKLSIIEKLLKFCFGNSINLDQYEWNYSHGSRNVVLGDDCEQLRLNIKNEFIDKLHNGEAIYGECVGYDGTTFIRPPVDNSKISKEFVAKYGQTTKWTYGCKPGQFRLAIYRITQTTTDGKCVELSWSQVKQRCSELGIDHVNEIHNQIVYDGNSENLKTIVEKISDGQSELDSHWREGCIIRVDKNNGRTHFLKNKNFTYKLLEGICRDSAGIDEEDAS